MKFLHLSDLHLGKRVHEFSMMEDQKWILERILEIVEDEKPEAVLIAGDVYDKTVPPAEAVQMFDGFLVALSRIGCHVFVISGNHDSAERIAFGARLMEGSKVHMSPVYDGQVKPVVLTDDFGPAAVYMLPFVKPGNVRRFYEDEGIESYTDAVAAAIRHMEVDGSIRNILVTHQFVTGATKTDSEEVSIGGTDNVDASAFDGFDYVALGHLHGPQNCGDSRIRYCGTPLKYSFSEARDQKSVTVVEMAEKGSMAVRTVPLVPKRDMVELKGRYDELMRRDYYAGTGWQEDYTHIVLTDEEDIPDGIGKLRTVYHNLMKLDYDNTRTRIDRAVEADEEIEKKTPLELFGELYKLQNNQDMTPEQTEIMEQLIAQVWEEEV